MSRVWEGLMNGVVESGINRIKSWLLQDLMALLAAAFALGGMDPGRPRLLRGVPSLGVGPRRPRLLRRVPGQEVSRATAFAATRTKSRGGTKATAFAAARAKPSEDSKEAISGKPVPSNS